MFQDRQDAAYWLAQRLKGRPFRDPLVLAIPRGGVVTGAVLAEELGAELDVALAHRLRAPSQPGLALGAIVEGGRVYWNEDARELVRLDAEFLVEERRYQSRELARREALVRHVRPRAPIAGRSVIVADDGIATGSTMIAALDATCAQGPYELIAAAPVGTPGRIAHVRRHCDEVVCLLTPKSFWAIDQFYEEFAPVEDAEVVELLQNAMGVAQR